MSKTIEAMTMVIMMTILDPPIVFNRPTPEKQCDQVAILLLGRLYLSYSLFYNFINEKNLTCNFNLTRCSVSHCVSCVAGIGPEIFFQGIDTYVASHSIQRNIFFSKSVIAMCPTKLQKEQDTVKVCNLVQLFGALIRLQSGVKIKTYCNIIRVGVCYTFQNDVSIIFTLLNHTLRRI